MPDLHALDDDRAHAHERAAPNHNTPRQEGARGDVGMVTNPRVVIDDRGRVYDHVATDLGTGIYDRACEDDARVADPRRRRDHRRGVDDRGKAHAEGDEAGEEGLAGPADVDLADAEHHRGHTASQQAGDRGLVSDDLESFERRPMFGAISVDDGDELDRARGAGGVYHDPPVSAGTNENRLHPTRHSSGMTRIEPVRAPIWKRVEDLVLGVPLMILASPLLAVCAAAILAETGTPVFYRDERVGRGGVPFRVWKFRTMVVGALDQGLGRLVSVGDARITRVGSVLRRWSLDELPQVINVVRGDMSLVGPRPTYAQQVARYTSRDAGRLRVKPGITGLAQVSGRNDLSWGQRIDLDLRYIDELSPLLDLRILLRTPFVVLRGIGLYGRSGITPDYEPRGRT